jgi:c-di-GMP-binding flagellar brake protein YcgR
MDNRRKHSRFEVTLAAEVDVRGEPLSGETRDVSEGGVAVILSDALEENSSIDLSLILMQDGIEDPNEEPFKTKATVVWAAPTEDGQSMMGLRFVAVAAVEARRLKRFLAVLARN